MPITEYLNALSFETMKAKERGERLEKAANQAKQHKSTDGLVLAYLNEIINQL